MIARSTTIMKSLLFRFCLFTISFLALTHLNAAVSFLGISSGDASSESAIVWTRAVDAGAPASVSLMAQVSTDPSLSAGLATFAGSTDPNNDYTAKVTVTGLQPATVYYYRFIASSGELSNIGKFKTAPLATANYPLHFAFSGDNDGLMRPYALANVIPSQNLDFYINLGDVIYENASNVAGNNGASYLNSPSVTLSNDSLSFNGIPRPFIPGGAPFATQAQLLTDYAKKYDENFLPVNIGGQNSLQVLYAAQGNYITWDNHELGNRKYIDGGAPAGGSVGGPLGIDMTTGRGVDARNNGAGNPANVNDAADPLSPAALAALGGFMNKATGFQTLENVFLAHQPIANRGTISNPNDPRTDGTRQLYSATQWGKNALYINTDARSYRDIRLKTANAGADDTGSRADNPNRTYLGRTQLAWLEQTLLDAQNNGINWKFVSLSDPIDQIGPIGGSLSTVTAAAMQPYSGNLNYGPVNSDGGKSFIGGYRAERNALLKFIADNNITNVVFLATDDHQNRINELYYSSTGQTGDQSTYVKVPYTFSIVCGPLGATGPDLFTNHTFAGAKGAADLIANAQIAAGISPIGLENYPGLHNLFRDGDPSARLSPQPVDFYSPDTFNFTTFDVSADGKTLTVTSMGMNATAQNAAIEYVSGPQAHPIFGFQIDAPNRPPVALAKNFTVSAGANCQATVTGQQVDNGSYDPDSGDTLTYSLTPPGPFAIGTHSVTLTVTDNSGASSSAPATITVVDTTAPVISGLAASPNSIWPPNGKLVDVTLSYSITDCSTFTSMVQVTSNEATSAGDIVVVDPHHLRLRATRDNASTGRIYTVVVTATDSSNNASSASTTVTVPHDQGKGK
jgi:phosphodiesterase/alkaline phosphatase D-like protein